VSSALSSREPDEPGARRDLGRRSTGNACSIDRFDRRFQKIYVNTLFTYTLVGYTATTATRDDDDDDDDDDVHSHRLID
jgi:hypothetical protein